jgi:predicted nucleic acid-binding protein
MRIVLDTNVFISGIFFSGPPYQILKSWRDGRVVIHDDPSDDKFLEAAVAGNASYVISGDKHLLKLSEYQGIQILKPRDFVQMYLKGKAN